MKRLEEDSNEMRRRKLPEAETSGKHSTGISIDDTSNFDEEIGSYLSATGPASPEILSLISAGKRLFYPKTVTTYPQKMYPMSQLNSHLYRKTVITYPQKCTPKLSAGKPESISPSFFERFRGSREKGDSSPSNFPGNPEVNPKMYPMSQLNSKMYPKMYPKTYPKTVTT